MYHPERNESVSSPTGKRAGNDKYGSEEKAIQGFIRRVGAGKSPSLEAVARAEALGYELAPNETYVQPFIRRVLKLKKNLGKKQNKCKNGERSANLALLSPSMFNNAALSFSAGAGDGVRTRTVLLPRDFESRASACSTTPANMLGQKSSLTQLSLYSCRTC